MYSLYATTRLPHYLFSIQQPEGPFKAWVKLCHCTACNTPRTSYFTQSKRHLYKGRFMLACCNLPSNLLFPLLMELSIYNILLPWAFPLAVSSLWNPFTSIQSLSKCYFFRCLSWEPQLILHLAYHAYINILDPPYQAIFFLLPYCISTPNIGFYLLFCRILCRGVLWKECVLIWKLLILFLFVY